MKSNTGKTSTKTSERKKQPSGIDDATKSKKKTSKKTEVLNDVPTSTIPIQPEIEPAEQVTVTVPVNSIKQSKSILSRLNGKKMENKDSTINIKAHVNEVTKDESTEEDKEDVISNISSIPKKRGRKPKDRQYDTFIPNQQEEEDISDNIIIHLPIKPESVKNIISCDPKKMIHHPL